MYPRPPTQPSTISHGCIVTTATTQNGADLRAPTNRRRLLPVTTPAGRLKPSPRSAASIGPAHHNPAYHCPCALGARRFLSLYRKAGDHTFRETAALLFDKGTRPGDVSGRQLVERHRAHLWGQACRRSAGGLRRGAAALSRMRRRGQAAERMAGIRAHRAAIGAKLSLEMKRQIRFCAGDGLRGVGA